MAKKAAKTVVEPVVEPVVETEINIEDSIAPEAEAESVHDLPEPTVDEVIVNATTADIAAIVANDSVQAEVKHPDVARAEEEAMIQRSRRGR